MDRTFKRDRVTSVKRGSKGRVGEEAYEDLEIGEISEELHRVRYNQRFWITLYTIAGALLVGIALIVLITNYLLPIVKVTDNQMAPAVKQGQRVVAKSADQYRRGDIIAFHNTRKILVRRIIACENDWVNIASDGTVYVNDVAIAEPYASEIALGECSFALPCRVPRGSFFVLSDCRTNALDSRDSSIGYVTEGQIVGRIH